ncbi:MAG: hypothetical protein KGL39_22900 [Patescibacteria group bacterium]|nr:hypothetical protein [Patescibacteria group bacterium]
MKPSGQDTTHEGPNCPVCGCNHDVQRKIDEVHTAVIGNTKIGLTGLVTRVANVERWQRKALLYVVLLAGAVATAVPDVKALLLKLFAK